MPSLDFPLLSDWPEYLENIFQLYGEYVDGGKVDPAWEERWNDPAELPEFSAALAQAVIRLKLAMARLKPLYLPRDETREEQRDIARQYLPVWQQYREWRRVVRIYEEACRAHGITPDFHIRGLWDSYEMTCYERVRKWLDYRRRDTSTKKRKRPAPRQKAKERHEERTKWPEDRQARSDRELARYYEKLGKPVPTTKRTYRKNVST